MASVSWVNAELEVSLWFSAHTRGIRPTDLLVLLTLNTFADRNTRRCYPSIAQIAERSLLDVKTARESMGRLVESGLIERVKRPGRPDLVTLTPPETGTTENGRGTETGTTENGPHPYRKREGTPTKNGTRTSKDQELEPEDLKMLHHYKISVEEAQERRRVEPGWFEDLRQMYAERKLVVS